MTITELCEESHQIAVDHGFTAKGREIFCEKMLLIVSEISEALEEFRDGRGLNEVYYSDKGKPEGIPVEIADAVIRIADFCKSNDIYLENVIKLKMEYNKTRPYKHGRQL